jgi:Flp pilus assembly protein TadD
MGYSGETNDINFSRGTTAFNGFLGFPIYGESTNGDGWGISLANLGNYKEVIKSYDEALELKPDDAKTIYEKAISLNNLGKHRDAERLVSKARDMGLNV